MQFDALKINLTETTSLIMARRKDIKYKQ